MLRILHMTLWIVTVIFVQVFSGAPECPELLNKRDASPLITQDSDGYLHVKQNVADLVSEITESIGIVSIVGPYRTGKSYLMNQLINSTARDEPFGVGETVQAHSTGISIFAFQKDTSEMHGTKSPKIILFADTAGLYSPHSTDASDARIVALTSLISSIVIYNNNNVINAQEVDRFNFIMQYARAVPRKDDIDTNIKWQEFQPDLLWIIRDFFLALKNQEGKDITEREWIDESLSNIEGASKLYQLFNSTNVFTMPRPTNDDDPKILQSLAQNPNKRSDLFLRKLNEVKSEIFSKLKYKSFNGNTPINGKLLIQLINTCVRRLNSDKFLNSIDTMQKLINAINEETIQENYDKYLIQFENEINNNTQIHNVEIDNGICAETKLVEHLPIKEIRLYDTHNKIIRGISLSLRNDLYNLNGAEFSENEAILHHKINKWLNKILKENKDKILSAIDKKEKELVEQYKLSWNEEYKGTDITYPTDISTLNAHYKKKSGYIEKYMYFMSDLVDDYDLIDEKRDQIKDNLREIYETQLKYNYQRSHSKCEGQMASAKDFYDKNYLRSYYRLGSLKNDLKKTEEIFNKTCKGPAFFQYFDKFAEFRDQSVGFTQSLDNSLWAIIIWPIIILAIILLIMIWYYGYYQSNKKQNDKPASVEEIEIQNCEHEPKEQIEKQ